MPTKPPWETYRPPPRPEAPVEEPRGGLAATAKKAIDLVGKIGPWFDKTVGRTILGTGDPALYRLYERQMLENQLTGREQAPASEFYKDIRRTAGWSAEPSGAEKALGMGWQMAEYPLSAAGSVLGGKAGSVAGPIGMAAGGLAGRAAGLGAGRTMANLTNPELAGRNLWWDIAGVTGGRLLGTGAAMAYRKALQPALASKGILDKSAHPVAARVIDWAEKALDPMVGPAAKNYGLPRWTNRALRQLGPQGVKVREAAAKRITDMAGVPGKQLALRLPAAQGRQGVLPLPGRAVEEAVAAQPSRRNLQTVLKELPPEPEDLSTISQLPVGATIKDGEAVAVRQTALRLPRYTNVGRQVEIPFETSFGKVGVPKAVPGVSSVGAKKVVQEAASKPDFAWRDWAMSLRDNMNLPKEDLHAILRVQQSMAQAYGETPDTMIRRMFRGILPEDQWNVAIPGVRQVQGRRGIVDYLADGKALIGISKKTISGEEGRGQRMQTILHEMMHVYLKWMPEDMRPAFSAALNKSPGTRWTRVDEHKITRWFLEFLRMGYTPHSNLTKAFSTFHKSMGEIEPFQMGSGMSAKSAMAPELGHAPKEALAAFEKMFKGGRGKIPPKSKGK